MTIRISNNIGSSINANFSSSYFLNATQAPNLSEFKQKLSNLFQMQLNKCRKIDDETARKTGEFSALRRAFCDKIGFAGLSEMLLDLLEPYRQSDRKGIWDLEYGEADKLFSLFVGPAADYYTSVTTSNNIHAIAKAIFKRIDQKGVEALTLQQLLDYADSVWGDPYKMAGYAVMGIPDVNY